MLALATTSALELSASEFACFTSTMKFDINTCVTGTATSTRTCSSRALKTSTVALTSNESNDIELDGICSYVCMASAVSGCAIIKSAISLSKCMETSLARARISPTATTTRGT